MPSAIALLAAGGLARETLAAVKAGGQYRVAGIFDDDPAVIGSSIDGVPVLGTLEAAAADRELALVICAGNSTVRHRIAGRLGVPDDRYGTVIHPAASVADGATVGAGSILLAGVVLTAADVVVGRHVVAMPNAVVTHGDSIGDCVTLCAGVALGGEVHIAERAYLGMNSSVRQGVRIGAGATLGMGAVLLSELPAEQCWAGVPARPLRDQWVLGAEPNTESVGV